MEDKKIEIVFPCYNRREITLQCLRSIARLDSQGMRIHVVVVDDGSSDGTSEAVSRDFPEVEIVKGDGNLWFTEGTNVGVRAALKHDPDYVLMINDDQVFDALSLSYMVDCAEKYPRSVVGATLLLWDVPHKVFQVAPVWDTWSGGWRHWRHQTVWTLPQSTWEVGLIVGNCVLVPSEAFKECGLMDAKRYPSFGDAEFTPRLKKKGWRLLIEPRARVFVQPNNPAPQVRKMGFKEKVKVLILDLKQPHNLRRRFYANLDGAPNKVVGFLSFCIFFWRLFFRMNAESDWAEGQKEKPLFETFKSEILK